MPAFEESRVNRVSVCARRPQTREPIATLEQQSVTAGARADLVLQPAC